MTPASEPAASGHPITLSDYVDCWYVPGATAIIDLIHPVSGLTLHFKKDAAAVRPEYPTALRLPLSDATDRCDAAAYRTDIVEIAERDFSEALEVLPPVGWRSIAGVESFRMSERTWGSYTAIYARCGNRYFSFTDGIRLPSQTIADRVHRYVATHPVDV